MTAVGAGAANTADTALVAREVLAFATGGTLHVRGIDDDDPAPAGLGADATFYDEDGVPTFAATPDSPLARAARVNRGAVLAIPAAADTGYTQLVLGGHLTVLAEDSPDTAPAHDDSDHGRDPSHIVAIGLLVHTVVLERDVPDATTVGYRTIDLDAWAAARPDPLGPAAQRILAHTNGHHAADLRRWVAGLRGLLEDDVLAAQLFGLDADGVNVRWLDERGAHDARVRFPRRAGCPGSLAAALRETVQNP